MLTTQNQRQLIRFLNKYSVNSKKRRDNISEYWKQPKQALKQFTLDNPYDSKIYDLFVDSHRQSQLAIIDAEDSSEDENFSIFGTSRAFPDV